MHRTDGSDAEAVRQPQVPQRDGVAHAATNDAHVLPVIDVTHPRFAVPQEPESARALYETFAEEERRRRRIPRFIMRMMLRSAAKRSLLLRAIFYSPAGFLDGLSTYVMKLGPDNLPPPYDSPMDRRLAASPHVVLLRLRLHQTARLLAEGLAEDLPEAGSAPLHLVNVGGGPALDSTNALILLNRHRPDLLKRPIVVHVFDPDDAGPSFGANALLALMAEGGPLHGLEVKLEHRTYDWNEPGPLDRLVRELSSGSAVVAASSEGALFEYGSDEAIIANLRALRADGRGARLVVGSVTSRDETRARMIAATGFKLVPRGLDGFAPLAARARFTIARAESAMLSDQVLLRPIRP